MMSISDIDDFFRRTDNDIRVNTSYPLEPVWFADYKEKMDLMRDVRHLSYYIHIPFCRSLCKYCEYTRFLSGNAQLESHYIDLLRRQVDIFLAAHKIETVRGLDVGGGTPTALLIDSFRRLMEIRRYLVSGVAVDENFESSIEFSFDTIDAAKIELIAEAGFSRVSSGLQAVGPWFDKEFGCKYAGIERLEAIRDMFHECGVRKLNLDLMYGFNGQPISSVSSVLQVLARIMPEQVTLYEMRYNMRTLDHSSVSREGNFRLYTALFEGLLRLGYHGRFGQNTLTLNGGIGVSSYIASRMTDALPYKGFGASAQSMSDVGISYNNLKGAKDLVMPDIDEISECDIYKLPGEELAAKYVSIALYDGRFDLKTVSRLLATDAYERFRNELDYLTARHLIEVDETGIVVLTEQGVRYSGAIGSLFWPKRRRRGFNR